MTEAEVLAMLAERYSQKSQGLSSRYAFATHVRSAAGFDASRTADAVAMDTWPGQGLQVHGHEVKVSRSDWLRELAEYRREPGPKFVGSAGREYGLGKAEAVGRYCHRWWVVVSDRDIVKPGELPDGWGLMAPRAGKLVVVRGSIKRDPLPMPPTFVASFLRAAIRTARG